MFSLSTSPDRTKPGTGHEKNRPKAAFPLMGVAAQFHKFQRTTFPHKHGEPIMMQKCRLSGPATRESRIDNRLLTIRRYQRLLIKQ